MSNKLLDTVSEYYTNKVKEHGTTSKGVDWSSKESQVLRFDKLLEVLEPVEDFSLMDYGCGTGDLVTLLKEKNLDFTYHGFDISQEMISVAKARHALANVSFSIDLPPGAFDYIIASGIFNVRFNFPDGDWDDYIKNTLDEIDRRSTKGFSFNVLSLYSDVDKRRSDLFYADPLYYFDLCKKKYSRYVTLLHDYKLYEFTILVRKDV